MPASKRKTPPARSRSKEAPKQKIETTRVNVENQSTYNKLIKRGMSENQARAFSKHAGGGRKKRAGGPPKSSKPVTKRLTRTGKKNGTR